MQIWTVSCCVSSRCDYFFFFWCVLIESCFLPCLGLLSIWRWNQWLKSTAGCNHLDNWDIWEDEVLQWGEPWAFEDSVCTGSLQTPEEARPVPSCEHLCPSVLVWPKHWQEWRGGKTKVIPVGHILPQYHFCLPSVDTSKVDTSVKFVWLEFILIHETSNTHCSVNCINEKMEKTLI